MQVQATTAPQGPAASGTPGAAAAGVAAPVAGVPITSADIRALRAKRSELSNQLESAAGRRQRLSSQLTGKEGADRAGIEARIGVLDKRIMQLESDIAETGRLLTMAPGALVATTEPPSQFFARNPESIAALSGVFIIFVLAPIAFAAARLMWKRAMAPPPAPSISADASRRLERLEQGMDAIAIEIERVSEGQRFVTRLLSETHETPLSVSQRIAERSRVGDASE
jgi:hypothetical protein